MEKAIAILRAELLEWKGEGEGSFDRIFVGAERALLLAIARLEKASAVQTEPNETKGTE